MFICLKKDKWVTARCSGCGESCGLNHPTTQEHGTRLFGAGFESRQPASAGTLTRDGSQPE
jgi:hypothetical protein